MAKPIMLILVGGAPMPRSDELPASLRTLALHNAVTISLETFDTDVTELIQHTQGRIDTPNVVLKSQKFNLSRRARGPDVSRLQTNGNQLREPPKPIFVSFSKHDQAAALEILGRLEAADLKCWISCRDVPHGYDYQDAIVDALDTAGAMVLVFSKNANNSAEIKRELALASANSLFVLPVRIENAEPTKGFKYQLVNCQYVNLFEDRDTNMTLVVDTLKKHLQSIVKSSPLGPGPYNNRSTT